MFKAQEFYSQRQVASTYEWGTGDGGRGLGKSRVRIKNKEVRKKEQGARIMKNCCPFPASAETQEVLGREGLVPSP